MSDLVQEKLDQVLSQMEEAMRLAVIMDADYRALVIRHDDALKRINDLQSELEYLRQEVNRG